jgi:hypothetical protein
MISGELNAWQPIETTKRDGHRILLAGKYPQYGWGWTEIGHWNPTEGRWEDDRENELPEPELWAAIPALPANPPEMG